MNSIKKTAVAFALSGAALFAAMAPAHADFMIDPNPDGLKFFIDIANKGVTSFSGTVGANNSGPIVDVVTVGKVDTGAGFATIKPASKNDILTSLTFTPQDPNKFEDFSFRGQLERDAGGIVVVTVQDNQGGLTQSFSFSGLGSNADFGRIGIVAVPGTGETIKWVKLESNFKEEKQNLFSTAVPEPETYALMIAGLVGAGFVARRRKS